ncbi:MAG: alkaline phosphatase, partial [Clostridia bacterium]|nr:alkaline phosphatase [Clostridia bacterium]
MRLKRLLSLLLTVLMLLSSVSIISQAATPQIKNIIFMIPDGGSMASFYLADAVKQAGGIKSSVAPYATKQTVNYMYMKDYLIGSEKTYCADNAVTDSAAAGTALAGGYKTNTYHVGVKPDLTPSATLIEVAQSVGKKTGMVATYEFSNATPAAFSAHESHRDHYPSISRQIAHQGIDVILGGGFSKSEWPEAKTEVQKLGYNIIDNRSELNAVKKGDKIWGNLFSGEAAFDHQNTASDVTISEMTTAAIRALENDNGFFLMVEGSKVDGGGHDNNGLEMIGDYIAFDEACKIAVEYAKGRNDTLVLMAPDHDTGGMNVVNQATAVSNIQNGIIPGTSALTWETKQHTARNGGVFLYAPAGVAYPAGLSTNPGVASNFDNYVVENTVFAPYLANIMGVDTAALNKELFVDVTSLGTYTPYTVNYSHRNLGHAMSSNEHTGIFTFTSVNASIERNTSILKYNDQSINLDGMVSVYENGRFYVPQMALDILELEAPGQGGSGTITPESLITTESLYSMGTAGSLWGDVNEYNGATGSGNSVTIQASGYVTFKLPVPKAGIYYFQVKSSGGNTTLEAQINAKYLAELPVSSEDAYYYQNAEGGYEFLYSPRGSNVLKLTNTGSEAVTLTSVELIASQVAVDNGVTPTMDDVKLVGGGETEPTAPSNMTYSEMVKYAYNLKGVSTTNTGNVLYFMPSSAASVEVKVGVPKTGYYNVNAILGSSTGGSTLYDDIMVTSPKGETAKYPRSIGSSSHSSYVEALSSIYLVRGDRILTFNANTNSGNGIYLRGVSLVEDPNGGPQATATPAPTATPVPGETPAYVTSTSINMPGTGATIAACLTGGTGASARSDGFIDLQGGGKTATFTIPAPQAGIYYVQIKATAASAIR